MRLRRSFQVCKVRAEHIAGGGGRGRSCGGRARGVANGGTEHVWGWGLRVQDASDSAGVPQARCQPACEQGRGVGI